MDIRTGRYLIHTLLVFVDGQPFWVVSAAIGVVKNVTIYATILAKQAYFGY